MINQQLTFSPTTVSLLTVCLALDLIIPHGLCVLVHVVRVSDTSQKYINREGVGRRRIGTRKVHCYVCAWLLILVQSQMQVGKKYYRRFCVQLCRALRTSG